TKLRRIQIAWPRVTETTRVNLAVSVSGAGEKIANDWDFWVFPRASAPEVRASADPACLELLKPRYPELKSLAEDSGAKLQILTDLDRGGLLHLEQGGDVLLLGGSIRAVTSNPGLPLDANGRPVGGEAAIAANRWSSNSGGKPFPLYTGW